jgi:CubicO group peptidase (beta-lactamase class C family)
MKRSICALILICALTAFSKKDDPAFSKDIDALIQREMKELGIPGMSVSVVRDGKVIHLGSYGIANIEWNQPVSPTTSFQIASVTKLFTSTLVMKYMQEGKIDLEDPVTKYLPNAPASWSSIKIRHLLSHQSGIPWPASIGGFLGTRPSTSDKPASKEQVFKDMTDSALVFKPGDKESYMNGDAFVIQMVLEAIGGKNITTLFDEELFKPLQMKHSGFDDEMRNFPAMVMKPLSHKSQIFTKGKTGPLIYKSFYNPTSYCSGGLYMSVEDAVKWAQALDNSKFIQPAIIEKIKTSTPLHGSFTALGWNREVFNKHESYGHSGGPGLGDILRFPDQKLTIIVFSNYADMYPYLAATIAKLYFPDITLPAIESKTLDRGYDKQ